jgi:hypothetical protein
MAPGGNSSSSVVVVNTVQRTLLERVGVGVAPAEQGAHRTKAGAGPNHLPSAPEYPGYVPTMPNRIGNETAPEATLGQLGSGNRNTVITG